MNEKFKVGDIVVLARNCDMLRPMKVDEEFEIIDQQYGTTTLFSQRDEDTQFICSISDSILMEYFVKAEVNSDNEEYEEYEVCEETIDEMMENAEYYIQTQFDRCTVMTCKLPNGFIITESSACVSEDQYDFELGKKICKQKIKNRLWEMEAYFKKNLDYLAEDAVEEECTACSACNVASCDCDHAFQLVDIMQCASDAHANVYRCTKCGKEKKTLYKKNGEVYDNYKE